MEISFDFDTNDWAHFQMRYLEKTPKFVSFKRNLSYSVPSLLVLLALYGLYQNTLNLMIVIIFIFISAFWISFFPKRYHKSTFKKLKKILNQQDLSKILGQRTYKFIDDQIHFLTPYSEGMILWNQIKKVESNSHYYFLYENPETAIIIPKLKLGLNLEELTKLSHLIDSKTKVN